MTIFKKIIDGEIPCKKVFEDDLCLAFHDINPQAPIHVVLIPKILNLTQLSDAKHPQQMLLGHLLLQAANIAKMLGVPDYRVVINNGAAAGQTVFHLHLHILAGRNFGWPPG